MLGRIFSSAVAVVMVGVPAMATTPTLSGKYVYTEIESCSNGNGFSVAHTTGIVTFAPATGTVSLSGFHAGGNPPALSQRSGTRSYSNTETTITIDGTIYDVFYGKVANGVATHLSYIGVVPGNPGYKCSDQATLEQ